MSGIESYGGQCPVCKKGMLMKWVSSPLGFRFDACPWCGFAYGTTADGECTSKEVWDAIFHAYKVKSMKGLIRKLKLTEYCNETKSDLYPSVFDYSKDSIEELNKRIAK